MNITTSGCFSRLFRWFSRAPGVALATTGAGSECRDWTASGHRLQPRSATFIPHFSGRFGPFSFLRYKEKAPHRWRGLKSVAQRMTGLYGFAVDTLDFATEPTQLAFDIFISAINMVDTIHHGDPFSDETGQYQTGGGAQIRGHHLGTA